MTIVGPVRLLKGVGRGAKRLGRGATTTVGRGASRLRDVEWPEVRLARSRRAERQARVRNLVLAAAGGAILAYFLDPTNGRRRRKVGRDRLFGAVRGGARRIGRFGRRAASDTYGLGQRLIHRSAGDGAEADDVTIAQRVRSEIFRDPGLPKGRVNVNVEDGVVVLRGELDRPEQIETVERETRRIAGVRAVDNRLHLINTAPPPG